MEKKLDHKMLGEKIRSELIAMGIANEFADKCYQKWMHLASNPFSAFHLRKFLVINIMKDFPYMDIPFTFVSRDDEFHKGNTCLFYPDSDNSRLVAVIELLPDRRK